MSGYLSERDQILAQTTPVHVENIQYDHGTEEDDTAQHGDSDREPVQLVDKLSERSPDGQATTWRLRGNHERLAAKLVPGVGPESTLGPSQPIPSTGLSDTEAEINTSGFKRTELERDSSKKMILTLQYRDAVKEVDTPLNCRKNSPVCRHPIRVNDIMLEACIDSGATVCLMSRRAYGRIKSYVGPLQASNRRACGASGTSLEIDGWVKVPFRMKTATYTYGFLVGNLSGVDCLLGLDWLHSVGAVVDFSAMTAELGPTEKIQLREEPQDINFCSVKTGQTLVPRSHTRVRCRASWWNANAEGPAVFEPGNIRLGPGLSISPGIVNVETTGHFYIAVTNDTVDERDLPDQILIGHVDEIQIRRKPEKNVEQLSTPRSPLGPCLWTMVNHRLEPLSTAEEELWKPHYVDRSVVGESERSDLPGEKPNSEKHYVRVIAADRSKHNNSLTGASLEPPTRVRIYDRDGVELVVKDLDGTEVFDFLPDDQTRTEEVLSTDLNSRASRQCPSRNETVTSQAVPTWSRGSTVHRLPEHLKCVLPPPGTLTDFQLKCLVNTILEYEDVFVGPDGKVGYNSLVRHRIDTGDATPYKCHPRKKSLFEKEHIRKEVQKLLEEGFIKPSASPWGAAVVLAKKKDGTLRFCIDYRKLNDMTKKDAYPLPRIEECLDALNGCMYFCTMDLASGYWQVAMDLLDIEKTAFTTHVGLYEWNVMPFGLCNAPATFSRMMEMVLSDVVWKQCLVYLDDVVAFGKSYEGTLSSLRAVLARLRTHNLKLKAKKCEFFRTEVEYLGHEVGRKGVRPSLSKIQALHNWKIPTDVTQIKSFLGFTGFYRRFIRGYADLAKPLTEKTKGGPQRKWEPLTDREITAFRAILQSLSERVLLHYVIPGRPFYLVTDASDYAIGGVLEHRDDDGNPIPLAFASKTLEESRTRYCATKKELYAIVYFMRYFLGFYRGTLVNIETDHYALEWLMSFELTDSMYHRWITELGQYKPWTVKHRAGVDNVAADALSRKNKPDPIRSKKPYRDCTVPHCEICAHHFRKNRRCLDEDSDVELDDDDPDRPDHQDLALWDLMLMRCGNDPTVLKMFMVTRGKARELENCRTKYQPPRRSARVAAKRAEARAETARGKKPNPPTPPPRSPTRVHRDRVRRTKYEGRKRSERKSSRRKFEVRDSGYSSGCSEGVEPEVVPPPGDEDESVEDPTDSSAVEDESSCHEGTEVMSPKSSNPTEPKPSAPTDDGAKTLDGLRAILYGHSNEDWVEAQLADPVLSRLIWFLRTCKEKPKPEEVRGESEGMQALLRDWYSYEWVEGILCRIIYRHRFTVHNGTVQRLVPAKWRLDLWREVHKSSMRHLSYAKVYEMLMRDYTWYNMSNDVLDWGNACLTCQKTKPGIGKGLEELKQEYVCRRGQRVAMDLVGPLPESDHQNKYILVIQDYYTKWVELCAIRDKRATSVAFAFLQSFVAHWGCPETLHSDQGNEFDAAVFREMCDMWGIKKTRTTPFNPSSNGMVERSNRTMLSLLRNMAGRLYMTTWDRKLPMAMMAMNSAVHSTTGFAPFKLQVAGCEDMRLPHHLLYGKPEAMNYHCLYDYVFQQVLAMQEIAELVRLKTGKALAAQRAARERGPLRIYDYQVGDIVLRYYPPYASQKLHHSHFDGPLEVVEVDKENRKVKLKNLQAKGGGVADKWVHVSALKPVVRTKDGLILGLFDGDTLKVVPGIMDPGPKYTDRVLPKVANFSSGSL